MSIISKLRMELGELEAKLLSICPAMVVGQYASEKCRKVKDYSENCVNTKIMYTDLVNYCKSYISEYEHGKLTRLNSGGAYKWSG